MANGKVNMHEVEAVIAEYSKQGKCGLTDGVLNALVSHAKAEERAVCHAEITARWHASADGSEGKYWLWRAMEVIRKGGGLNTPTPPEGE